MTTIAANLKEMSGDSRVTIGSIFYHADKIFRIGDSIVGVCGDAGLTTKFLAWFRKECPSDEVSMTLDDEHQFNALVLNARGLFLYSDCSEPDRLHDKFFAIGAGADIALAAMVLGKNPTEAVQLACKLNPTNSGLPVKTLTLAPKKSKVVPVKTAVAKVTSQTDSPAPTEKE